MGLVVEYNKVFDAVTCMQHENSWTVCLAQHPINGVVEYGFVRRHDAEIALAVLNESGIDWDGDDEAIRAAIVSRFGSREAMRRHVIEHLQW